MNRNSFLERVLSSRCSGGQLLQAGRQAAVEAAESRNKTSL